MATQTIRLETHTTDPSRPMGRQAWFSATARSKDGMKWTVSVVADYVASETHVIYEPPFELMQERFTAFQAALQARAIGQIG